MGFPIVANPGDDEKGFTPMVSTIMYLGVICIKQIPHDINTVSFASVMYENLVFSVFPDDKWE